MLPPPSLEVFAGLVLLFVLALPTGLCLVRIVERWFGRSLGISVPERALLAFYATGALLFVVASVPVGVYGLPAVVIVLAGGWIGLAAITLRERAANLAAAVRFLRSFPGAALALGSVGLLVVELWGALVPLPNGVDGSVYALFVNVLLRDHGVAWTLAPYANTGIVYPQGAPVWMTLPVLLFGWPIVSAPVVLPPLFLSFTPVAAFSFGDRLGRRTGLPSPWSGLLFAGFFGLVASWPRFYVAGSYDFIFALPLFLVALGLFATYLSVPTRPWGEVLLLGLFIGALSALSVAIGTALCLLLLGYVVFDLARRRPARWAAGLVRVLAVFGVAALFVARSLAGLAMWYQYPGHVLTQTGAPPYAPLAPAVVYSGWIGQLDPFVLWKPKISPIPILYGLLEILLVAGIVLALGALVSRERRSGLRVSERWVAWVLGGVVILGGEIALLLGLASVEPTVSGIQSVTNVWETSFLLFIFYSALALTPLIALARYLVEPGRFRGPPDRADSPRIRSRLFRPERSGRRASATAVVAIVLVIGAGATVAYAPSYIHSAIVAEANATTADVAALQWAGSALPTCSRVLVAPGSAAQFLPEYAEVHLVFPVFPSPTNRSYKFAVDNLTAGTYDNGTRTALLQLGITEVFVTGQTTDAFLPFQSAPLRASSDFTVLFASGDAAIFGFSSEISASDCGPT